MCGNPGLSALWPPSKLPGSGVQLSTSCFPQGPRWPSQSQTVFAICCLEPANVECSVLWTADRGLWLCWKTWKSQMILCYTISFIEACEGWCVKSVGPDIPLQLLSWVPGHFVFPYYRLRGSDERSHQLAATESRDMTSTRPGKMQKELDTVVLPSLPAASSSRLSLFCCCFRIELGIKLRAAKILVKLSVLLTTLPTREFHSLCLRGVSWQVG